MWQDPDLDSFAQSELSDRKFCAETCVKKAIKIIKPLSNCDKHMILVPAFPFLRLVVTILRSFSDILRNHVIA